MEIEVINHKKASQIIETRKPIGIFIEKSGSTWCGIDNSTGDAWVREFSDEQRCRNWLQHEPLDPPNMEYKMIILHVKIPEESSVSEINAALEMSFDSFDGKVIEIEKYQDDTLYMGSEI